MKCPHCKKEYAAPAGLERHTEVYGNGTYHVRCIRCEKPVLVRGIRRIVIRYEVLGPGDKAEMEQW